MFMFINMELKLIAYKIILTNMSTISYCIKMEQEDLSIGEAKRITS